LAFEFLVVLARIPTGSFASVLICLRRKLADFEKLPGDRASSSRAIGSNRYETINGAFSHSYTGSLIMLFFQGTDNKLWTCNLDGSGGVNLGGYQTSSPPVVAGKYIYFRGTDDQLWRINLDGTGGMNVGGNKTSSTPWVTDKYVVFQGNDNRLLRINLDGTNGTNLGGNKTASAPFVSGDYVYFQGTDNRLLRIGLEGQPGGQIAGWSTSSMPFVTDKNIVFRGTDDKLWVCNLDGSSGNNVGGNKTISTPCVSGNYIYYQGNDNRLLRIGLDSSGSADLGYKTAASPAVDAKDKLIFFEGTDNTLWRINLDGSGGRNVGGYKCASTPFVDDSVGPPVAKSVPIFFRGTDNVLWRINSDGSGAATLQGYKSNSTPIVLDDAVFFQGTDNTFWRCRTDGSNGINLGGYKLSSPPCIYGGYIYFQGTDNKLWRTDIDGNHGENLGGYATKSTPVAAGDKLYFQGTDDKLWCIHNDGSSGVNLGSNSTSSAPFVTDKYVVFRGTDDRLLRIDLNGNNGVNLGGNKTASTPFVAGNFVYFQGTDNRLLRIGLDGSGSLDLGYKTASSPMVDEADNMIVFQGTDNALWRTDLEGKNADHIGGYATASTPFVVDAADQSQTGTAAPAYMVLTLVYAPPGMNPSAPTVTNVSEVDYGQNTSTGTTTSISSSFQTSVEVKASAGIDDLGLSGSMDFQSSFTSGNQQSVAVTKTESMKITLPGPSKDGINHDEDTFYIWLNPELGFSISPGNTIEWAIGVAGPNMEWQKVSVGELKNPATIDAGKKTQMDKAGFTESEYGKVLALNPFASGKTAIDSKRYFPLLNIAYDPPTTATDPVSSETYLLQNNETDTNTLTSSVSYGVKLEISAGFDEIGTKIDTSLGFQWTNSASTATTNVSATSANLTIGGPAYGYSGPTDLWVYWDGIYSSYMFSLINSGSPSLTGQVVTRDKKPAARVLVTLTVGSKTYRAYASRNGTYRFFGTPQGAGKLSIGSEVFPITIAAGKAAGTIQLKNQ
jgi:Domain of unknown function (DUF5050)